MKIILLPFLFLCLNAQAHMIEAEEGISLFNNDSMSGCTQAERKDIKNGTKAMRARIKTLSSSWHLYSLEEVKKRYILPQGRIWIEGNPAHEEYHKFWKLMGHVLRRMNKKSKDNIRFHCATSDNKICNEEGGILGYVYSVLGVPQEKINLCPIFFKGPKDEQERTLLHELSHMVARTNDSAGGWWDIKNPDLKMAAKDAYLVQKFMDEDPEIVLEREIWRWLWTK